MSSKIRVYLDTSVISYLDQQDMPDRMRETQEVWEILKSPKYRVIISDLAMRELNRCTEDKREKLLDYISMIDYEEYAITQETEELAQIIVDDGILKPKSLDDATHIAAALLSDCKMILSWNFKHLVNFNTINGVRRICFRENINRLLDIYSPYVLWENEEND